MKNQPDKLDALRVAATIKILKRSHIDKDKGVAGDTVNRDVVSQIEQLFNTIYHPGHAGFVETMRKKRR